MQRIDDSLVFAATDVANHLACHHLTQLNRRVADGEAKRPHRADPALDELIERGKEHERKYVEYLKRSGKSVIDVSTGVDRAGRTLAAMVAGTDVIVQAEFRNADWLGYVDLLYRVENLNQAVVATANWKEEIKKQIKDPKSLDRWIVTPIPASADLPDSRYEQFKFWVKPVNSLRAPEQVRPST